MCSNRQTTWSPPAQMMSKTPRQHPTQRYEYEQTSAARPTRQGSNYQHIENMLKLPASTTVSTGQQRNGTKQRRRRAESDGTTRQTPACHGDELYEFSGFNQHKFEHSIGDHRSSRPIAAVKRLYTNDDNFDCPSSRSAIIDDEHRAIVELESEIQLVKQSLHSLYKEIKGEKRRKRRESHRRGDEKPTNFIEDEVKQQQEKVKKPEKAHDHDMAMMRRCLQEKQKCYRNIEDNLFILKNLDRVMAILSSGEGQNV